MIIELVENTTKKMSDCVYAGYEQSLKKYHGMITKGVFSVAVKAAPSRDAFFKKLDPELETEAESLAKLRPMLDLVSPVLAHLNNWLKQQGIEDK